MNPISKNKISEILLILAMVGPVVIIGLLILSSIFNSQKDNDLRALLINKNLSDIKNMQSNDIQKIEIYSEYRGTRNLLKIIDKSKFSKIETFVESITDIELWLPNHPQTWRRYVLLIYLSDNQFYEFDFITTSDFDETIYLFCHQVPVSTNNISENKQGQGNFMSKQLFQWLLEERLVFE